MLLNFLQKVQGELAQKLGKTTELKLVLLYAAWSRVLYYTGVKNTSHQSTANSYSTHQQFQQPRSTEWMLLPTLTSIPMATFKYVLWSNTLEPHNDCWLWFFARHTHTPMCATDPIYGNFRAYFAENSDQYEASTSEAGHSTDNHRG